MAKKKQAKYMAKKSTKLVKKRGGNDPKETNINKIRSLKDRKSVE